MIAFGLRAHHRLPLGQPAGSLAVQEQSRPIREGLPDVLYPIVFSVPEPGLNLLQRERLFY